MELSEIREAIDLVDRSIGGNVNDRFALTEMIADIKLKSGDAVFKPDREKEMEAAFSSDDPMGTIRKEMVLQSRRKQYIYFREHGAEDDTFTKGIGRRLLTAEGGDTLTFRIGYSDDGTALNLSAILRVLSDLPWCITDLRTENETVYVSGVLFEDGEELLRQYAYLLYKECTTFEIIQEEES